MCAGGYTTSALMAKMQKFAEEGDVIDAKGAASFSAEVDNYDVFLVGPQVRHLYKKIEAEAYSKGKAVGQIDPRQYALMDGEAMMKQARELFEQRKDKNS